MRYQIYTLYNKITLWYGFPNITDSITLSGDERELGKVCVRLNYQEALEQVWITLVQVRLHIEQRETETCIVLLCNILSMDPLSVQKTGFCQLHLSCCATFSSEVKGRSRLIRDQLVKGQMRTWVGFIHPQKYKWTTCSSKQNLLIKTGWSGLTSLFVLNLTV